MWSISFANTMNDVNPNLPKSRWDCFDYGSWYGCDDWCPQWQRWECEVNEENMKNLETFNVSLDIKEFNEIKSKYALK